MAILGGFGEVLDPSNLGVELAISVRWCQKWSMERRCKGRDIPEHDRDHRADEGRIRQS